MRAIFLLVFVIFGGVSSAPSGSTSRMIGGTQAAVGQFPFVVSISQHGEHICGGFIYNDRWIVTAASCVHEKPTSELEVTAGASSLALLDPDAEIIPVTSKVLIYEEYDPMSKLHDVALVQLVRQIVFNTTIQSIRYDEIDEDAVPVEGTIIGWDATVDGGLPHGTGLLYAKVENLLADCRMYSESEYNPNFMICAGNSVNSTDPSAPCDYDQGNPLTQVVHYSGREELVVVGIMSKNHGCKDTSIPSIYTRLSAYYFWFLDNAGGQTTQF